MQGKHLFEYAVIRVVPRVEREEFINVGVVLYCARQKYLKAVYRLDVERITAFSPGLDIQEVDNYLQSFCHVCEGSREGGPIGRLPIADRFRWLTATRSTVVQASRVHPGYCTDAEDMLMHLYAQLVL